SIEDVRKYSFPNRGRSDWLGRWKAALARDQERAVVRVVRWAPVPSSVPPNYSCWASWANTSGALCARRADGRAMWWLKRRHHAPARQPVAGEFAPDRRLRTAYRLGDHADRMA